MVPTSVQSFPKASLCVDIIKKVTLGIPFIIEQFAFAHLNVKLEYFRIFFDSKCVIRDGYHQYHPV